MTILACEIYLAMKQLHFRQPRMHPESEGTNYSSSSTNYPIRHSMANIAPVTLLTPMARP